ncbi:MAG: competence/damage-inducible protein A [Actinomycetota bacterium]
MRAEIVSVGTELLLGEIPNTNAQVISERLATVGVDVMHHSVVGDNEQRIAEVIKLALGRSDAVVMTGGLGPTHDDVTREALAAATGRELTLNTDVAADLREWFEDRGREMDEINLRQAYFPEGGIPIANSHGTAPGIELEHEGKLIFAVPGVPSEMMEMLQEHLLPRLASDAGGGALVTRNLKVTGLPEADVAAMIQGTVEAVQAPGSPKLAIYSSVGEVRLRISTRAKSTHAAYVDIFQVENRLRKVLGSLVFGADDDILEGVVGEMAKEKGLTVGVAESFTGGALIARLISAPDASEFVNAGYVTYSIGAKESDLGVAPEIIERHGAVSAETAIAMAEGARARSGAAVGLSTTGEAGPVPAEEPVGTMFLGITWEGGSAFKRHFATGNRDAISRWGTQAALDLFRLWMLGEVESRQP